MTDEAPSMPVELNARTVWPARLFAEARPVNQILIASPTPLNNGTQDSGVYLALGHVPPPLLGGGDEAFFPADASGTVTLPVDPIATVYLSKARAQELLVFLRGHLESTPDEG